MAPTEQLAWPAAVNAIKREAATLERMTPPESLADAGIPAVTGIYCDADLLPQRA